jgi:DNA-binding response OmpR family regulator
MRKAKILWIEGNRAEEFAFIPALRKKGYSVSVVSTGQAALASLSQEIADLVVINAAALRTSGKRICQDIHTLISTLPVVMIVNPTYSVTKKDACAQAVLILPFTPRKLINRISPLLPADEEDVIRVGAIQLNPRNRRVRCETKESRLTPRLARLLTALMNHPGEVFEREPLFREVWRTGYTEDTRTLDVHISWLRKAIEENPRNPRFLITIRGVGYRLDV